MCSKSSDYSLIGFSSSEAAVIIDLQDFLSGEVVQFHRWINAELRNHICVQSLDLVHSVFGGLTLQSDI